MLIPPCTASLKAQNSTGFSLSQHRWKMLCTQRLFPPLRHQQPRDNHSRAHVFCFPHGIRELAAFSKH